MPRKKVVEYREQIYDIGDGATVTVRYRVGARPKMFHNDTQVIIGEATTESFATRLDNPRGLAADPGPSQAPMTNYVVNPQIEAQISAMRKKRPTPGEIIANSAGAAGGIEIEDFEAMVSGLDAAAMLNIPS